MAINMVLTQWKEPIAEDTSRCYLHGSCLLLVTATGQMITECPIQAKGLPPEQGFAHPGKTDMRGWVEPGFVCSVKGTSVIWGY